MSGISEFLRRINPFDGVPYSAWNTTKNNVVGSRVYTYKGVNYLIKSTDWTNQLLAFVGMVVIKLNTALTQSQIGLVLKVLASNTLQVNTTDQGIEFVAGYAPALKGGANNRKVFFNYLPDYAKPVQSIVYFCEFFNLPSATVQTITAYATGKENIKSWLNGTLTLIALNHVGLQNFTYDITVGLDFIEKSFKISPINDPNINPATGQPYGFGSADLETGEITQDGVIIKPGMDISQLKKVITNDPNQAKMNIWPWLLVLGGAVLLRKKKRKNK